MRPYRWPGHVFALAVAGALLTSACSSGATGAGPTANQPVKKVVITEAARGYNTSHLYVAEAKGFFKEQGIEVEIKTGNGGPSATNAVLAGESQFATTGHGAVASLALQGKQTKIIYDQRTRATVYFLARPEINSFADLKGKKIGVGSLGNELYGLTRVVVKKAGLDPDKDVEFVVVGSGDTATAALVNDSVQAILGTQPQTASILANKRANLLAKLSTPAESEKWLGSTDYSYSVIQTTNDYIKQDPDAIQRFVNAIVKAQAWLRSAKVDEIVEVVAPYFQSTDKALLKAAYEQDSDAFPETGLVTQQGHDTALNMFREAGLIKADQTVSFNDIVDNSFTETALKEPK